MTAASSRLFPAAAAAGPPARTLRDLIAAAWRQLPLILGCTALLTLLALWLYYQQPKVFTSSAKIWVQTEQQGSPSFLSGIAAYRETPYPDPVNRKIETEIELMLTRSNAQAVVQRLDIQDAQLARGAFGSVRARLAGLFGVRGDAADAAGPPSRFKTVDAFLDGISIEPLRSKTADTTSNVLEVRFECADAALAPRALQAFLDNYLQLGALQNRRLGETTFRLLESKLVEARDDLRRSEDEIVALRMTDSERVSADLSGEALAAYAATPGPGPAAAMQALGSARLRLDTDTEVRPAGSGPGLVIASLKAQSLELQQRLDEARQLFTDDAEIVRSLRNRLANTRKRLVETVRENTQVETQLGRLERQRALAQDRYVELQRKLDQIDLYLKLNPTESDSRVVVDAPYKPTAREGKRRPVLAALGPVAGLLLGLLLAGLRELGSGRMRSVREAGAALGAPVLGAVPSLSPAARQALVGNGFAGAASETKAPKP